SRKSLEPHIYTHWDIKGGQALRLAFNGEGDVPFACRGTADRAGLDLAFDRPMVDHLDSTDLGEGDTIIMGDAKSTLREREAIVASLSLKTWEARLFRLCFDASEEGLKGQVNSDGHILQDLRMDVLKRGALFFQYRIG